MWGLRVYGFRVSGLGFRAQGGFRAQSLRFWACGLRLIGLRNTPYAKTNNDARHVA